MWDIDTKKLINVFLVFGIIGGIYWILGPMQEERWIDYQMPRGGFSFDTPIEPILKKRPTPSHPSAFQWMGNVESSGVGIMVVETESNSDMEGSLESFMSDQIRRWSNRSEFSDFTSSTNAKILNGYTGIEAIVSYAYRGDRHTVRSLFFISGTKSYALTLLASADSPDAMKRVYESLTYRSSRNVDCPFGRLRG